LEAENNIYWELDSKDPQVPGLKPSLPVFWARHSGKAVDHLGTFYRKQIEACVRLNRVCQEIG
jgi:hypothetical protein